MEKKLIFFYFLLFISFISFAQEGYYNDVDLTLTGIQLKNALATKITTTHTNKLSYTPGVWEASKITDANPNNSSEVILIYGWENGTDGDITNDRFRINTLQDTGSGTAFVWNREHVFPKSLANPSLSTKDPGPGTDAHNLRPTDRETNSERSNKKFAVGSGNSGNVTGGWYPGDEWKGDVARIIMYMYVRYNGNGSSISQTNCLPTNVGVGSNTSTGDDMIDLFLLWNAEDPVSDIEKVRNTYHENTSNQYAQGNRNPFIDNPYLATRIWGGTPAEDRWNYYTLSVEKIDNGLFKLYPNPSNGSYLNIVNPSSVKINKIKIYTINGKEIKSISNPTSTINLNGIYNGLYVIKLISDKGTSIQKFIKN
ncbi:Extracellular ribonuclease [Polaribacter huanghezhanensis]|uniref:endonuclease n=1 Tax=Polaribacter huanghezhanensis TaxID=1354726 RepID=UPI002648D218|nr:endonuclease [Polaribacter huanghezhanensis]WKD86766.1 Extracellular ribonuclease [Polaribacter huanghezhanensis]